MNSLLSLDSALTVLLPLTDEAIDAEDVNAGWWYVLVFFALLAATILLWLSMRKQLKKIRFEEKPTDADSSPDGQTRDDHPPAS